jgi:hypothetical protein
LHPLLAGRLPVSTFEFIGPTTGGQSVYEFDVRVSLVSSTLQPSTCRSSASWLHEHHRSPRPVGQATHGFDVRVSLCYVNLAAHDLVVTRLTVPTFKFYWFHQPCSPRPVGQAAHGFDVQAVLCYVNLAAPTTCRSSGPWFRRSSCMVLCQPCGPRPVGQAAHGFDVQAVLCYVNLAAPTTGQSSGLWLRRSSCMPHIDQQRCFVPGSDASYRSADKGGARCHPCTPLTPPPPPPDRTSESAHKGLPWTPAALTASPFEFHRLCAPRGSSIGLVNLAAHDLAVNISRFRRSSFIGFVNLAAHDLSVKRLTVSTFEFHFITSTLRPTTWRSSGSRFRLSSYIVLRPPRGPRPGRQATHGFDFRVTLCYVHLAAHDLAVKRLTASPFEFHRL